MWVQAWVVAWVVCLAGHAHGQLGVGGAREDTQGLDTSTTTDQLLPDKHEKGKESACFLTVMIMLMTRRIIMMEMTHIFRLPRRLTVIRFLLQVNGEMP